jgi:hypothetical protein
VAFACALWIALDEIRHPQSMGVMNVVWPVTALYFSVFALWAYYRLGRQKAGMRMGMEKGTAGHAHAENAHELKPNAHQPDQSTPTAAQVAVGTSHCGAGCMLADVVCEFTIAAFGITVLGSMLLAEYSIDLAAAWLLGIVFQYFAIRPMRQGTATQALVAAIKADTLSILAFQVGMYAWMAIVSFLLFPRPHLNPFEARYWLMMQIAMICGYATSYPMNWWLIRKGIKEAMG